ncbi:hypothetical protein EJB05_11769, partial [Eragrostis curvula]
MSSCSIDLAAGPEVVVQELEVLLMPGKLFIAWAGSWWRQVGSGHTNMKLIFLLGLRSFPDSTLCSRRCLCRLWTGAGLLSSDEQAPDRRLKEMDCQRQLDKVQLIGCWILRLRFEKRKSKIEEEFKIKSTRVCLNGRDPGASRLSAP